MVDDVNRRRSSKLVLAEASLGCDRQIVRQLPLLTTHNVIPPASDKQSLPR